MHITSTVSAFRSAFEQASRAIPSKSPKPVLQHALLSATDGEPPSFSGTDLEVGLRAYATGIDVLSPGRCLLPTRLIGALSSLPGGDIIDLSADGPAISVKATGWKCKLVSDDPDLYPAIPGVDSGQAFADVAGADLRTTIRQTTYCQDITSTRYALGGSLFELDPAGSLNVVATDGRRLVRRRIPADPSETPPPATAPVLSQKFLNLLGSLIDTDAVVGLRMEAGRSVLAHQQGWTLYGRLVEGRFPSYRDVFPSESDAVIRATVNTADLLAAVQRIAHVACSDDARGVDLEWTADGLTITGESADRGQSDGRVAVTYEGVMDGMTAVPEGGVGLTLDNRYLIETLKASAPETLRFDVIDHRNALVLRGDGGDLQVCIMPLTRDR